MDLFSWIISNAGVFGAFTGIILLDIVVMIYLNMKIKSNKKQSRFIKDEMKEYKQTNKEIFDKIDELTKSVAEMAGYLKGKEI